MAYDVEVEWMDGVVKTYPKVTTTEEKGLLSVLRETTFNGPRVVSAIIPLENVREVRFP